MLSDPIFPSRCTHSKNPILVSVTSDAVDEPNIKVVLAIIIVDEAPVFFESNLDGDGKASWNISQFFDTTLRGKASCVLPTVDDNYIIEDSTLVEYSLTLIEVYGEPPVFQADSIQTSDSLICLYGGLSDETYSPDLFWDYRVSKSPLLPFLTWHPDIKTIRPDSLEYISYLPRLDGTASLIIELYERDTFIPLGTITPYTGMECTSNRLLTLNLNPVKLGLLDLDHQIGKFIIRLSAEVETEEGTDTIIISEDREYRVDYTHAKTLRQFSFINSISGKDSFDAKGDVMISPEYERNELTNYKLPDFYVQLKGTSMILDQSESFCEKINIGYVTKNVADWYRDFFLSSHRYINKNGRWIPIKVTSKKIESSEPSDLYSVSFEYSNQFKNNVYTPKPLVIE